MTEKQTKKNFERIWRKKLSDEKEVIITNVMDSDFIEERENKWGKKEKVYYVTLITPDNEQVEGKLIIDETDRAIGSVVIWDKKYVIWKNKKDWDTWTSFKIDDQWYNVEKKIDKNWKTFYKIKTFRKIIPEVEIEEVEEDFDL